jgi:hypothetical protein
VWRSTSSPMVNAMCWLDQGCWVRVVRHAEQASGSGHEYISQHTFRKHGLRPDVMDTVLHAGQR